MFDGKSSACKKVLLSLALATAGAAWSFDAEYTASQTVTISQAGSYLVTGTGSGAITIAANVTGAELTISNVTWTGDNTQMITNQRCAEMLGYGTVMANGDKLQIADDFTVEAVPAYNTTEGHLQFHPKGRDDGFILTLDGLRIYIAGDTEDIPEMAEIKDIDVAFMPCNQPYTMTPEQLINAARMVKPKVLFPYHYGQTDVSGIPSQLEADGVEVRIRHYE